MAEEIAKEAEVPKKEGVKDFFGLEVLSDITIVNPQSEANYKAHQLILASCSHYFLELFSKNDPKVITKVCWDS